MIWLSHKSCYISFPPTELYQLVVEFFLNIQFQRRHDNFSATPLSLFLLHTVQYLEVKLCRQHCCLPDLQSDGGNGSQGVVGAFCCMEATCVARGMLFCKICPRKIYVHNVQQNVEKRIKSRQYNFLLSTETKCKKCMYLVY